MPGNAGKVILLNYADENFRSSQRKNSRTGLSLGGFDRVLSYGPRDIDQDFYRGHRAILDQPRGNGYWLWKPYFIERTLRELPEGDWLFYCDAGSYFIHPIQPLLALAEAEERDIMVFADEHLERKYTKRDVFLALDADRPEITDSPQRLGGFSLWRNTEPSRALASEWLRLATDKQLLTDSPNERGLPDYPEFEAHRHDQSLFSVLTKRRGIAAHRDPSQWGNGRRGAYPQSTYPQLIELTRQRDVPWRIRVKRRIKRLLGG